MARITPPNPETDETAKPDPRKPYSKPAIIHELELETRAGSPLLAPFEDPAGLFDEPDF